MFIGMRQWQQRQETLVLDNVAFTQEFDRRGDIRLNRPMCQHHALGPSAGSGCIDETADIVGLLRCDAVVEVVERRGIIYDAMPVKQLLAHAVWWGEALIHHNQRMQGRRPTGRQCDPGCE